AAARPVAPPRLARARPRWWFWGGLGVRPHGPRRSGVGPRRAEWRLQAVLLKSLERLWRKPDEGIWEVRSAPRHFTYSKVMAWVAFDRGIKGVEEFGLEGPVHHWPPLPPTIPPPILAPSFHP